MKFVNLTPHQINVRVGDQDIVFPASGTVARVSAKLIDVGPIDGIPRSHQVFGEVEGLPDPDRETFLIVSAMVLGRPELQNRPDLVAPDTSPAGAIRDESGKIVAVKGWVV